MMTVSQQGASVHKYVVKNCCLSEICNTEIRLVVSINKTNDIVAGKNLVCVVQTDIPDRWF